MFLNKIKIHNFIKCKSLEISLRDLGLVLLKGDNFDEPKKGSSASGKSTFGSAIHWLLSGYPARKSLADNVIGTFADDCYVEGEIESGKNIFNVTRYRNHSKYGNNLRISSGGDISRHKANATQESLDKIMGCSFNLLRLSTFYNSNKKYRFSEMDSSMRAKIFDEIIGTDEAGISNRQRQVNKLMRDFEKLLTEFGTSNSFLRNSIDTVDENITNMQKIINDSQKIYAEQKQNLRNKIDSFLEDNLEEAESELRKAEKLILDSEKTIEKITTVTEKIYGYDKKIIKLDSEYEFLQKEIHAIESHTHDKIGQMCTGCGNNITEKSVGRLLSSDKEKIVDKNNKINKTKDLIEKYEAVVIEQKLGLKILRDQENNQNDLKDKKLYLQNKIERIEKDRDKAYELQEEMKEYDDKHYGYIEKIKSKIHDNTNDRTKYRKNLQKNLILQAKLRHKLEHLEFLSEFYGPGGFRPLALRNYSPILSEASNYFLHDLTGGSERINISSKTLLASGEVRDKIEIVVYQKNKAKAFPESFSAGEEGSIDLALNWGLMKLAQMKAGKDFNFYFFDESTDGLSQQLVENFFEVFRNKIWNKNITSIFTAHRYVPEKYFDHVWCAVKENDECRIEIER